MAQETKKQARRLRRLEQDLAEARELEARRLRKVEQAQRDQAPAKVERRRSRKLEQAQRRRADLEAKTARLRPEAAPEPEAATTTAVATEESPTTAESATGAGPATVGETSAEAATADVPVVVRGYCLRDRATVVLTAPVAVTMRNGRAGLAGTCPNCGSRVVRLA